MSSHSLHSPGPPPLLIYIHGFNSGAASAKAELTRRYLAAELPGVEFLAPTLSNYPDDSYQQLERCIADQGVRQITLVASSLGGFFATVLAQHFDLKAVLVNPVVNPHRLMKQYLGGQRHAISGERYCLTAQHVAFVRSLALSQLTATQNLLIMLQAGDEVLDHRQAARYYQHCQQIIEPGGNHSFQGFEHYLPAIVDFLQLR